MHCLPDSKISYESLMTKDVGLGHILPNCAWVEIFPWGFNEGIIISLGTDVKGLYLFCFV